MAVENQINVIYTSLNSATCFWSNPGILKRFFEFGLLKTAQNLNKMRISYWKPIKLFCVLILFAFFLLVEMNKNDYDGNKRVCELFYTQFYKNKNLKPELTY